MIEILEMGVEPILMSQGRIYYDSRCEVKAVGILSLLRVRKDRFDICHDFISQF